MESIYEMSRKSNRETETRWMVAYNWREGFPGGSLGKNPHANARDVVQPLGHEDPLKKEMATHSSILAWENPQTEEPGGLLSMGSQRVGHNLVTKPQ